jgi:hypothetical protein
VIAWVEGARRAPATQGLVSMPTYGGRSLVMPKIQALITLARPHRYIKNVYIYLLMFFAHKLFDSPPKIKLGTITEGKSNEKGVIDCSIDYFSFDSVS